ncbi:TadE/TadG family type IV pilus assembly protein [Methylobacterium aerolatum]|uniref:Flp pilus assembly protein TadG n=1 Tax=Methylobacterium aerolatum TaxID=418708 RepID=A0ABU0I2U5_9HYPH|nr:TadE/TadG family type IV pilus assembly protein [Methylobacterium aerolatum]MDQ0448923.1 Flp pilus assembly protein TadG [Methylobacterium aerolatum]
MDDHPMALRCLAKLSRCRRGGAAVEFALIAPVLLLLFAGIAVFGICLGAAHNLRLVAAEAARASIGGVTDAERASLAQTTVTRSLTNGALFRPGSVSVEVGADPTDANVTVVTVRLDASTLGLGSFARLVPQIPAFLTSTVSVRRGGL